MKKLFCLILAGLIMLSLCACGENEYEEYSELFEMLEDEDYDDAHEFINDLADDDSWQKVDKDDPEGDPLTPSPSKIPVTPSPSKVPVTPAPAPSTTSVPATPAPKISSLSLNITDLKLDAGETKTLTISVSPASAASYYSASWSVSDSSVVSIAPDGLSCKVTALNEGSTAITVSMGGIAAVCPVTVADPYVKEIASAEDFFAMSENDYKMTYNLVCDIDFSGYTEGRYWTAGIFNGNGYKFYNVGFTDLFGSIGTGAEVRDLTVEFDISLDLSRETNPVSSGMFCRNNGGIIENCTVSGSAEITVNDLRFGSFCCYNSGTIKNCDNYANMTFSGYFTNPLGNISQGFCLRAGGIACSNHSYEGTVTGCINSGDITATGFKHTYGAGIVCETHTNFSDCLNLGDLATDSPYGKTGGIINTAYLSAEVENCVNLGSADGGVSVSDTGYIINCYYILEKCPNGALPEYDLDYESQMPQMIAYPLKPSELSDIFCFPTLDFDGIWTMTPEGFPIPRK